MKIGGMIMKIGGMIMKTGTIVKTKNYLPNSVCGVLPNTFYKLVNTTFTGMAALETPNGDVAYITENLVEELQWDDFQYIFQENETLKAGFDHIKSMLEGFSFSLLEDCETENERLTGLMKEIYDMVIAIPKIMETYDENFD